MPVPAANAPDLWLLAGPMERCARRFLTGLCDPGEQTVGARIEVERADLAPLPDQVRCGATVESVEGRKVWFRLEARAESGELVARGRHLRVFVRVARYDDAGQRGGEGTR